MPTQRYPKASKISIREEANRKAVVTQMLAEREQRQAVSREELRSMRVGGLRGIEDI
jgi:hypothetical protein